MKNFLLIFIALFTGANLFAQVTTGSLTGSVKDSKETLIGASIKATHQPTGTVYSTSTRSDGNFSIPNMRVGGPYLVEISFVGYKTETIENVFIKLGEPYTLPVTLAENGRELSEVVILGKKDAILNSNRTGAATTVTQEQINNMPTLSRSLQDLTKLTPQANTLSSGGISFAGASNRYNSITIDGAVNNDVFGLASSGAPGGQANTQPISFDAIAEVQVLLAPYDVTQGNFTGGGINAVTRSGTNKFEGSIYGFNRNENITGKSIDGLKTKATDFFNTSYGARLGGPLIKNKLFFFVNIDFQRVSQPTTFNVGEPGSLLPLSIAQTITSTMQTRYGYDVGSYGVVPTETKNDKIFGKIDWNINDNNQLTFRHNHIKAYDDNLTRSATLFRFGNNAYRFNNIQDISIMELRSRISNTLSNNLIIGYSRIRDFRSTYGALFPQIQINNINGVSGASAVVGAERSSTANELDQDIFEFTDNFKIYANKHTFTLGTHNEFFKFRNLFINNLAGSYVYNNLADFVANNNPLTATATYSNVAGDTKPAARFGAAQLGFYFQDEIDLDPKFKLTVGFRADKPIFFDKPAANPLVPSSLVGYKTDQVPNALLVSPRMGFNWDVTGKRNIQVRGGGGVFTGRVPFVWESNQFTNSGVLYATASPAQNSAAFQPDVNKQNTIGGTVKTYEVDLVAKDFRLPQTLRFNLGTDIKLPGGILATFDAIYSGVINNIKVANLNLRPSVATINPVLSGGADRRPLYTYTTTATRVNPTFTNALLLTNSNDGYAYNLTAQFQKNFDLGLFASIAYTYGKSKDINSGTSSTALSNYAFVQIVNDPANPPLAYSNYDLRHRIVGALSYSLKYGANKSSGTTFSLFYAGKSGTPFTYLYTNDLNADGNTGNDLLYIPRTQAEINLVPLAASSTAPAQTAAEQWTALNAFIEADPYLRSHRGQYAERNGARMPWEHQFDLKIIQDIGTLIKKNKNSLQLSLDIINVGNLINDKWGRLYNITNTSYSAITYVAASNGFTFRAPGSGVPYSASPFASRYQGQLSLRYNFN